MRFIKSKLFLLILITIIALVVIGVSSQQGSKMNWVSNVLSVPLAPVQKLVSYASNSIDKGLSYFRDMDELKQENEKLKASIDKLEQDNRDLDSYRRENVELRQALNIKDQFAEYNDILGANIIAKEPGNWFQVFTIDRGTKDGLKNGYAVVTSGGLVGSVVNPGLVSSKVVSIIDIDSFVSVRINKTMELAVVKGDLSLKNQGLCRMEYISTDANIGVGDSVETSGQGGIYPKGILVGKVKEIRQTSSEMNRYAIIEPAVDFKRLDEVLILKKKADNE